MITLFTPQLILFDDFRPGSREFAPGTHPFVLPRFKMSCIVDIWSGGGGGGGGDNSSLYGAGGGASTIAELGFTCIGGDGGYSTGNTTSGGGGIQGWWDGMQTTGGTRDPVSGEKYQVTEPQKSDYTTWMVTIADTTASVVWNQARAGISIGPNFKTLTQLRGMDGNLYGRGALKSGSEASGMLQYGVFRFTGQTVVGGAAAIGSVGGAGVGGNAGGSAGGSGGAARTSAGVGNPGIGPGGGGGGGRRSSYHGGGGGGGAWIRRQFTPADGVGGMPLTVAVGAGGAGAATATYPGGKGGDGKVMMSWS